VLDWELLDELLEGQLHHERKLVIGVLRLGRGLLHLLRVLPFISKPLILCQVSILSSHLSVRSLLLLFQLLQPRSDYVVKGFHPQQLRYLNDPLRPQWENLKDLMLGEFLSISKAI
jgi:hypothetical protein